jgi:hypothetical protein
MGLQFWVSRNPIFRHSFVNDPTVDYKVAKRRTLYMFLAGATSYTMVRVLWNGEETESCGFYHVSFPRSPAAPRGALGATREIDHARPRCCLLLPVQSALQTCNNEQVLTAGSRPTVHR